MKTNSFGVDIHDFHDIILNAKIERGMFLETLDKSVASIGTVGMETSAIFIFNLAIVTIESLTIYGRAVFTEDKAWEFVPITKQDGSMLIL